MKGNRLVEKDRTYVLLEGKGSNATDSKRDVQSGRVYK